MSGYEIMILNHCETLTNNTFVTNLDLRYNNITDEGTKYIAVLIEVR